MAWHKSPANSATARRVGWAALISLTFGACVQTTTESGSAPTPPQAQSATIHAPGATPSPGANTVSKVSPPSPVNAPLGAVSSPSRTVVLAMMSGYTSCLPNSNGVVDPRTQAFDPFFNALQTAVAGATGSPSPYILTCFDLDATQVQYLLSTSGTATQGPLASMISAFTTMLATVNNPVVYFVGHSYGGWTAMSTVLQLSGKVKIGGLITLDPISTVNCTPENFIDSALASTADPGCNTSPTDFSAANLATIASSVSFWANYYEVADAALHSGPIQAATTNVLENYPSGGFTGHNEFALDAALATQLQQLILASVNSSGT